MNEREIFLAAMEVDSPDDRAAYVERACAGDPVLRERLEALLAFHAEENSFLDTPCLQTAAWLDGVTPPEGPGAVIGRYKILEQIGEGGFAVVFMAEQTEPVRRRVALKIIKPGMNSRQVIGRFEAERQALALMDHPNIAKIFDGGVTQSGRPYFAMELVNGIPLTRFCDAYRLNTKERLRIFIQICHAVEHAHQKGIIHRDLKPSNVLVTIQDDAPVPRVIDFGIAKATRQRLTERTVFTRFQHFIGTPAYMSPEQATFSGVDIDTRSDIYSLGVLLYELVTGVAPFDTQKLLEGAYDELCRIIREDQPLTPSKRISTLGEQLPMIAMNRGTDATILRKSVRGELDWIVMKALEKERNRRYGTASAMAADVENHLRHEPVLAGPPSPTYRFRKMLRRHRSLAAAVASVAAALILGTIVSTWGFVTAVRATRDAVDAKDRESSALQATRREVERNRLLLHVSEVQNAHQAWRSGNVDSAVQLLTHHVPRPGEKDLRTIPWYLMWNQCRQYVSSLPHPAPLHALAYSPRRQVLAAAGEDGLVTLWDALTRRRKTSLPVGFDTVTSIEFSPEGTELAVGGGPRYAARSEPGRLEIWDWKEGHRLRVLEPGISRVACVAYSRSGTRLACGNHDGVVSVWDLESPDTTAKWSSHVFAGIAWCLDFPPEGQLLVGTWADADPLRLWDFEKGQPARRLTAPVLVRSLEYSPDGRYLAIGTAEIQRPVLLQDCRSGELRELAAEPCYGDAVAFSPDGGLLFTGNGKGSIEVYDVPSGHRLAILKGHTSGVTGLCVLADGKTLASCGHDRTVKFWQIADALPPETYTRGHADYTPWMRFSSDGRLLATSSIAGDVRVWDVHNGRLVNLLVPESAASKVLKSRRMAFSPDGTSLATADYDGRITAHDLDAGHQRLLLDSGGRPLSLDYSADGTQLAAMAYRPSPRAQGRYEVLRFTCDTRNGGLSGTPGVVGEIELVPDAMPPGFPPFRFEPPPTDDHARISHDGRLLAYIYGSAVRFWNLSTGRLQILDEQGHSEVIFDAAFSSDDEILATSSQDKSIRLWDTGSGKLLKALPGRTWPLALTFAPDGTTLFTGDVEGLITMWDLRTDKEILSLAADDDIITCLALSPDGQTLATVFGPPSPTGLSGRIRLWRAPREIPVVNEE